VIDADQLLRFGQLDKSVDMLRRNSTSMRPPNNGILRHIGGDADGPGSPKGVNQGLNALNGLNGLHSATLMAFSHHVNSDICHATNRGCLSCDGRMSKRSRPPSYTDLQREIGARILGNYALDGPASPIRQFVISS
jgi:hypothetical protein